jgi:N-terminal acetyltransferase B complex catalytic subunit
MAAIRPLTVMDLFRLSLCNLDGFTETFNAAFYLEYLSRWPHLCRVLEGPNSNIEGYSKLSISFAYTIISSSKSGTMTP